MSTRNLVRAKAVEKKIAVIVVFHDMPREADRTLYSLTSSFQGVEEKCFDVVTLDNGSSHPLCGDDVRRFGDNFKYRYLEKDGDSPCRAINAAVQASDAEYIMIVTDGARILSPRILKKSIEVIGSYDHPFVYTLNMHLGPLSQNYSVIEGYEQKAEDALLLSTDWQENGYELFGISSVARSSGSGFFSPQFESGCYCMRKNDYLAIGGLNEGFESSGGGLASRDLFNRVNENSNLTPVMLLGEATFHQFHGGTATNAGILHRPKKRMLREYESVVCRKYSNSFRYPIYHGRLIPECHLAVLGSSSQAGGGGCFNRIASTIAHLHTIVGCMIRRVLHAGHKYSTD